MMKTSFFRRIMVMMVAGVSLTTVHAQLSPSQLKTEGDEPLLREWIKVLASDSVMPISHRLMIDAAKIHKNTQ